MDTSTMSSAACFPTFTKPQMQVNWQSICQLLIAALHPACIYRIEHKLSGAAGRTSYNNLIILLPINDKKPLREYEPILQLSNAASESILCSFHRSNAIAACMRNGHPFFCRALVPQNLIYDDGSLRLPQPEPAVMASINAYTAEHFGMFFGKAEAFYRCAFMMRDECPALTLFMLHQAVELGYRSVLESLNGYCKKTHELRQLRNQTFRCAPALAEIFPDDCPSEQRLTDVLEAAYSAARYDNQFNTDSGILDILFARIDTFIMVARACGLSLLNGELD